MWRDINGLTLKYALILAIKPTSRLRPVAPPRDFFRYLTYFYS
jgi:hypothetical protein